MDFRRTGMVLQWHLLGGTWTAYDNPPALVHGIALIRPTGPNICVFAQKGRLSLQIAAQRHEFRGDSGPRLRFARSLVGLGFRRRFWVESDAGGVLFSHRYWSGQRRDFFSWLAAQARAPDWPADIARRWSAGITPAELRAG
jgi:hypothetical protein